MVTFYYMVTFFIVVQINIERLQQLVSLNQKLHGNFVVHIKPENLEILIVFAGLKGKLLKLQPEWCSLFTLFH